MYIDVYIFIYQNDSVRFYFFVLATCNIYIYNLSILLCIYIYLFLESRKKLPLPKHRPGLPHLLPGLSGPLTPTASKHLRGPGRTLSIERLETTGTYVVVLKKQLVMAVMVFTTKKICGFDLEHGLASIDAMSPDQTQVNQRHPSRNVLNLEITREA